MGQELPSQSSKYAARRSFLGFTHIANAWFELNAAPGRADRTCSCGDAQQRPYQSKSGSGGHKKRLVKGTNGIERYILRMRLLIQLMLNSIAHSVCWRLKLGI